MYTRTDNPEREYEWVLDKAETNYEKHGIRFARAIEIFEDERLYVETDIFPFEERFIGIGKDDTGILLVVVFVSRGERIRITSAWEANTREREFYEGEE